jgi:predicted glycoside hydrolase/deacetylase ChbG (UPF0249 family)
LKNRQLIINADDFGLTDGVNQAILKLSRLGMVSSTSVMVNQTMHQDQKFTHAMTKHLGLGIHLNRTCGKPILPPEDVDTLVNSDGEFMDSHLFFQSLNKINIIQVEKEWRAQIIGFSIKFGKPDHLDSHHHIHLFPRYFPHFLQLASELKVPVRLPVTWDLIPELTELGDFSGIGRFITPEMIEQDLCLMQGSGIRFPDYFVENFLPHLNNDPVLIQKAFHHLPLGVTELMCHPGFVDLQLEQCSSYVFEREAEYQALSNRSLKKCLDGEQIEIINYKQV